MSEQEIIAKYRGMRTEVRQLAEKIAEFEIEKQEHDRVLSTLTQLEPTRKAFRMVGGVLVERNVEQVLPAVTSNKEGIVQLIDQMSTRLKEQEKIANEYQKKYNIKTQQES